MSINKDSCYFCDKQKTTKEHVPAKIFFPNEKYSRTGVSQRNGLITVPSCDKHNTEKSHLDEYLFIVITMTIMTNADGLHMGLEKMMKMIKRHKRVTRELLNSATPLIIKDTVTGEISNSAGVTIDDIKLQSCFNHISRAIYFNHFKQRFNGSTKAHIEFLVSLNENSVEINEELEFIRDSTKNTFNEIEKFGDNPEIFYYQVLDIRKKDSNLLRLCFYEQAKINVLMTHENHIIN